MNLRKLASVLYFTGTFSCGGSQHLNDRAETTYDVNGSVLPALARDRINGVVVPEFRPYFEIAPFPSIGMVLARRDSHTDINQVCRMCPKRLHDDRFGRACGGQRTRIVEDIAKRKDC
jgi:hypothetical protein